MGKTSVDANFSLVQSTHHIEGEFGLSSVFATNMKTYTLRDSSVRRCAHIIGAQEHGAYKCIAHCITTANIAPNDMKVRVIVSGVTSRRND